MNFGLSLSASISMGNIDFNEESGKELSYETFKGRSIAAGGGIGPVSAYGVTAWVDGKYHPIADAPVLYTGTLWGSGVGTTFGGNVSFQYSTHFRSVSVRKR